MALEISGKLIKKLDVQSGVSSNGRNWSRQDIIIEIPGQYPRSVCLSLWGDQVNEAVRYNIGDILKVNFDLQSREFNDKWYTSVVPWKIEVEAISVAASTFTPVAAGISTPPNTPPADDPFNNTEQSTADDLPF
ncbi:MAG: DUF3127 domain-containing protein [Prevotellaceae bacterium]|jgi:hypothetical protein|nr:DUF3127 domain-containing protein [Prevotellaceae bacterium]